MLRTLALATALVATSAFGVFAHRESKTLHGGKVVDSGHHHLELVAADGTLSHYVRDEADKASATVLADGKTEAVALQPAAGGVLNGKDAFKASKGVTVAINLTMPDHKREQARFKLD